MALDQKAVSPDAEVYSLMVYGVNPPTDDYAEDGGPGEV